MIEFLLLLFFVYVPALIFYLFSGVIFYVYLKKYGYLDRFKKKKKTPELEVIDDEKE